MGPKTSYFSRGYNYIYKQLPGARLVETNSREQKNGRSIYLYGCWISFAFFPLERTHCLGMLSRFLWFSCSCKTFSNMIWEEKCRDKKVTKQNTANNFWRTSTLILGWKYIAGGWSDKIANLRCELILRIYWHLLKTMHLLHWWVEVLRLSSSQHSQKAQYSKSILPDRFTN